MADVTGVVFTGGGRYTEGWSTHVFTRSVCAREVRTVKKAEKNQHTRDVEGSEREGVLHYPLRRGGGVEGWDQSFCMRRRWLYINLRAWGRINV